MRIIFSLAFRILQVCGGTLTNDNTSFLKQQHALPSYHHMSKTPMHGDHRRLFSYFPFYNKNKNGFAKKESTNDTIKYDILKMFFDQFRANMKIKDLKLSYFKIILFLTLS